ncbi:MAG: DegV family protein [Clostridiales bacterium]|nr:DegV family protein [Clostridiales bacterium]
MSVLIFDSNCELWHTRAEELGLDYISMPYMYNGEEYYYDLGKNTDFKKFYNAVRGGVVPKTMALNPENYKEILSPYFEKGEDVLYVSFSHKMSGTFGSLDIALKELKEKYPERKCTVFNTLSISIGALLQVEAAAELKKQGKSDEEIIEFLNDFTNKVSLYFMVDSLMHLKRGGRLSATAAVAGTMLGLKPVLTCDEEGGLKVIEKVSGRKKAIRKLAEKVVEALTHPEYKVYIVDADCPEDGQALAALVREKRPDATIVTQTVGPVIGSHCGPGTLGVAFVSDSRPIPLK